MSKRVLTRRSVIVAAATAAIVGVLGLPGDSVAQDAAKKTISGRKAKEHTERSMKEILQFFEKEYGAKYSEKEKKRIIEGAWPKMKIHLAREFTFHDC